jgi:hypothetical protein
LAVNEYILNYSYYLLGNTSSMDSPISSSFIQNQTNSKIKTHRIQFDDKENKSTFINNSNTHQIHHEDIHHIKTGA